MSVKNKTPKTTRVSAWVASVPLVFVLESHPDSSISDICTLVKLSKFAVRARLGVLRDNKKVYISSWSYGRVDQRGGKKAPRFSVGNLPDAEKPASNAPSGRPARLVKSLVRRDWLQSAFFGYVEPHVSTVYSSAITIAYDEDEAGNPK